MFLVRCFVTEAECTRRKKREWKLMEEVGYGAFVQVRSRVVFALIIIPVRVHSALSKCRPLLLDNCQSKIPERFSSLKGLERKMQPEF